MRVITEDIAQFSNGMYFLTWQGDDILIENACDDESAQRLGAELRRELDSAVEAGEQS